jgi:hypothetical protein
VALRGFRLTNRVANPVLRRVLRMGAGRVLGRRLAVLRYTGARTGRPHELVTMYVRDGGTVWILVGHAEQKTWWRNLRSPAEVDLWLAGERVRARAAVVDGAAQPVACAAGLRAYLAGMPAAARALGLPAGPEGASRADDAALADAAARTVLVRADVREPPSGTAA